MAKSSATATYRSAGMTGPTRTRSASARASSRFSMMPTKLMLAHYLGCRVQRTEDQPPRGAASNGGPAFNAVIMIAFGNNSTAPSVVTCSC